ncbi:GNAT family N-acetyltransferase [Arthrobacter woluwensis]|uniref:GNAT family N-acetyltransferase n=1 Tax=Arthrobacter woluwensis TaxID=156980 RepID=UPI003810D1B3
MVISPIRTERLLLRPPAPTDAPVLGRIRSLETVHRYLSQGALDEANIREGLKTDHRLAKASTAESFRYTWVIELQSTGQVIGDAKTWTTRNPPEPGPLEPGQAALGYALDPAFHRQGYGREAALALVDWLFTERDIRTAFAGVFEPNVASQALLRSLGFTPDLWFTAEQDQSGKGLPSIRFRLDRPDPAWPRSSM